MDSAQMFLVDSVYGPLQKGVMLRKNKNGTYYRNVVPSGLVECNLKMGVVDGGNQVRTGFYNDEIDHHCIKWTVRYYERLEGFGSTNAYNLYKYNNRDISNKNYFHFNFVLQIIQGMIQFFGEPINRPLKRAASGSPRPTCDDHQIQHIMTTTTEKITGTDL